MATLSREQWTCVRIASKDVAKVHPPSGGDLDSIRLRQGLLATLIKSERDQ